MSDAAAIGELLAGLPLPSDMPIRVEKLGGGLNNRVYRIFGNEIDHVLRLGPKQAGLPDIDCELSILGYASTADIGPAVEFADPERGILLLRFVPGRPWEREDLVASDNLEVLAALLRRVHALPACGTRLDISGLAESNARRLYRRDDLRDFGAVCLQLVSQHVSTDEMTCCHNDVVAANLVAGQGLRLIDWEWAADNDPLFDLASVVAYHDLEPGHADRLLGAYTGGIDASLEERFHHVLRLFDALQWLWLAARESSRPDEAQLARLKALRARIPG